MDLRTEIIDNVIEQLDGVDREVIEKVERTLYIQLQKYEVQDRCTEVTVREDRNMEIVKKFLATKRLEGKSDNTLKLYSLELRQIIGAIDKKLSDIGVYDLRMYLSLYKERRKVSNTTLENKRKVLSSFFSWAYGEALIPQNPTVNLKQIKIQKVKRKPFSAVEMMKIKGACKNARDKALIEFMVSSGLRVSEVSSVNISDIDFAGHESTVIGKGNKERIFYISDVCAEVIKEYLQTRTDSNPALFVSNKAPHNRLSKAGVEAATRKIGKRAGVTDVHPHRFRRTFATDMVRKGVPIQYVSTLLGHADLRTTQIYVSIDQDSVKYNYNRAIA